MTRAHEHRRAELKKGGSARYIVIGLLLVAVAIFAIAFFHSRNSSSGYQPGKNQTRTETYAGSVTCQSCHEEEYDDWKKSHHALAERDLGTNDWRAFQHWALSGSLSNMTLLLTNAQPAIEAEGPQGNREIFKVERVIGESPLRQFLVSFPGGRLQALEASYDPRSNQWFNVFGEENRRPGEWGHWTGRGMNWNAMCASCHNTRLKKNYNEATDSYTTSMAEMSVGCEACHGPMKEHNDWQQRFGKSGKTDPTLSKLTRPQTLENCAYCHARRSDLTGDFKSGDHFSDNVKVATVDRTETFYADGQIHDEDYEYSAFLGSRMHAKNVICTDCHNPHTAKPILPGNWLCLRCHAVGTTNALGAPPINPVLHSHHQVFGFNSSGTATNLNLISYDSNQIKETGGECVNCHMPQTTYMQRHGRHDHGFTIPDPLLTKEAGIPNACNRCHQDKDSDWALKSVEEWYGEKMNRPTRRRAEAIEAARRVDTDAYKGLLSILSGEEIPYWRAVEAGLLGPWIRESSVQAALLHGLSDTNDLARAAAVETLAPLAAVANAAVEMALQERLTDPVRSVRIAAAWALAGRMDHGSPAWHDLEQMLAVNSDQPAGQMQAGEMELIQGDTARGLEHYRKAVSWDATSPVARHDYAIILSQANQPSQALEQMEAACRLAPTNGEFQYELALAYHAADRESDVIPALTRAIQLDATLSPAWYNLGLAYSADNKFSEALEALGKAESLEPEARIPYARATILARMGRMDDATKAARRALELQPDFQPAQELLRTLGSK